MDATAIDTFIRRTRLWLGAAMLLISVSAGAGAWVVGKVTADVRRSIADTHDDLVQLAAIQAARAQTDSLRFERAMEVLNLAVGAIVEAPGTPEQRGAVEQLRRLRHFTP